MLNYKALLFMVFVLSFCLLSVENVGATSPDDARSLFYGEVAGDYLCAPRMTQRYPERCPSLSPGARDVRLEYLRARLPHPLPSLPMEEIEVPEEDES
ncbi:MAG: hypothetical protein ACP5GX_08320, partial [Anaerolineae bacterium]